MSKVILSPKSRIFSRQTPPLKLFDLHFGYTFRETRPPCYYHPKYTC